MEDVEDVDRPRTHSNVELCAVSRVPAAYQEYGEKQESKWLVGDTSGSGTDEW